MCSGETNHQGVDVVFVCSKSRKNSDQLLVTASYQRGLQDKMRPNVQIDPEMKLYGEGKPSNIFQLQVELLLYLLIFLHQSECNTISKVIKCLSTFSTSFTGARSCFYTQSAHIDDSAAKAWLVNYKNNSQQFLAMGSRWGILYTVIWVSARWHPLLWDITASSNKAENPLNRQSVTITPIHSRSIFVEVSRLCTHFKTNYTLSCDIVAQPAFAFGCLLINTANSISHCFCWKTSSSSGSTQYQRGGSY